MSTDLRNVLANQEFSRKEKVLVILGAGDEPKAVNRIRKTAITNGLPEAKDWNLSQILKDLGGSCVRLPSGWVITNSGRATLEKLGVGTNEAAPSAKHKPALRKYAAAIQSNEIREFLEEAVGALELGLLRAAVVFSWVGAVSVLYKEVVSNHLSAFNAEASKRTNSWKPAKTTDELTRMKEYDFLQVLAALSIIGKNTKEELEACLKLRNACGHPSSVRVGEYRVSSHIETLTLNVYSKFAA